MDLLKGNICLYYRHIFKCCVFKLRALIPIATWVFTFVAMSCYSFGEVKLSFPNQNTEAEQSEPVYIYQSDEPSTYNHPTSTIPTHSSAANIQLVDSNLNQNRPITAQPNSTINNSVYYFNLQEYKFQNTIPATPYVKLDTTDIYTTSQVYNIPSHSHFVDIRIFNLDPTYWSEHQLYFLQQGFAQSLTRYCGLHLRSLQVTTTNQGLKIAYFGPSSETKLNTIVTNTVDFHVKQKLNAISGLELNAFNYEINRLKNPNYITDNRLYAYSAKSLFYKNPSNQTEPIWGFASATEDSEHPSTVANSIPNYINAFNTLSLAAHTEIIALDQNTKNYNRIISNEASSSPQTFAHELTHALGNIGSHSNDPQNLMFNEPSSSGTNFMLTPEQCGRVLASPFVTKG